MHAKQRVRIAGFMIYVTWEALLREGCKLYVKIRVENRYMTQGRRYNT